MMQKLFSALLLILTLFTFFSCKENDDPTPNYYTIRFLDGDDLVATQTDVAGTIISAPTLIKDGYTLAWEPNFNPTITGDATYTAVWTPIPYIITYELDGGTNATSNPINYTIESDTITFAEPTKEGYIFTGWYPTSIEKGSIGDITVTATWEVIPEPEYTVTFKDGDEILSTITGVTGTEITAPFTEKPGYTSSWDQEVASTITGDATYTVVWTLITYTITYELDGGTNATSNPTSYTIESDTITFAEPTKEGYIFVGWDFTSIEKGTIGDITVTATWEVIPEPETYTVTFIDEDTVIDTITGVIGTEITAPTVTEKTGYTYSWAPEVASTIIGDVTYTVVWTPITYTITYELDGGTNATSNPTYYTIEDDTITFAEPTKEGYAFVAWNPTSIEKGSTGDKTVTASWEESSDVGIGAESNSQILFETYSTDSLSFSFDDNTRTLSISNSDYTVTTWLLTGNWKNETSTEATFTIPSGLAIGKYTISVTAKNSNGNIEQASCIIVVN